MPRAPATSEMLAEMSACAYRLGMRFAAEAEATKDNRRCLEFYQLFDRCFFAVRVATALQLRLRREGAIPAREHASDAERLEEPEPLETERPERAERYDERDRDRETERASLPVLITTLKRVATDAAALPGLAPAELPTLQEVIARATRLPFPRSGRGGPSAEERMVEREGHRIASGSPFPPPALPPAFVRGRRAVPPSHGMGREARTSGDTS